MAAITRSYVTIIFLCTIACICKAEEFLYPVATIGTGTEQKVYVLYQKSLEHIELWLWDPVTKAAMKALLSTFTPAGISLLPDDIGFSFIDNGRIKVKIHSKRSPKSLEWYEPVYDIGNLTWITSTCYFFHAKEHEHYGIFHGTMHSEIDPLVLYEAHDCMYPQKVGGSLFYIERAPHPDGGLYTIMRAPYPAITCDPTNPFNNTQNFERRVAQLLSTNFQKKEPLIADAEKERVLDFGQQPIAFLHMTSDTHGFCIGHPAHIDKQDKTMTLVCYQVCATNTEKSALATERWHAQALFTFEVPLDLLLPESSSRLYESILPLLPRYTDTHIYFVDSANHASIRSDSKRKSTNITPALFCYDRAQGTITQLSHTQHVQQAFFAPLRVGDTLLYGGSVLHEEGDKTHVAGVPGMWLNEHGLLCIELPQKPLCQK